MPQSISILYTYTHKKYAPLLVLLVAILMLLSCHDASQPLREKDKIIASVGSRILYASDLSNMIHPTTNDQDSAALATAYIDQWVRDKLMARQAAKFFSSDFDIERLVDDYREKLLKFHLEDQIIQVRYDTAVTQQELSNFYDEIKEQFLLKEDIYRVFYAKYTKATEGLTEFVKSWKNNDHQSIKNFSSAFAIEMNADTSRWISWSDINVWSDQWSKSKANQITAQRQNDLEYEYFLKIVDRRDKGAISPLEYIEPQLVRMILHRRKQTILEDYKQELYEEALNNNIIKLP